MKNSGTEKLVFHVISQTHWDREWYATFERFRSALVEVIDRLLNLLEKDDSIKFFMFDGQTVILEDYLEIRPENEVRIKNLIQNGKILVGPWYLLADMFLPSGEALVRNLLLGKQISEEMGRRNDCGYLPDVFGFNSQVPQILNGFGIDNTQIFRGVGKEIKQSEFLWEAPDGTQILATYLPGGYYNFKLDELDIEKNVNKALSALEELENWRSTNNVVLMNGMDHYYADEQIHQKISVVNKKLEHGSICQSTLPVYVDSVKEAIEKQGIKLQIYSGEFRENRPARITPGVISTRIYLKQENAKAQALLERFAEPLSVFNWMSGDGYDRGLLKQSWKYLIRNHPHDSICGCSIDDVHSEMMSRYFKSEQISAGLISKAINSICLKINTASGSGIPVIVFNTLQFKRTDPVKMKLFIPFFENIDINNSAGRPVPFHIINRKEVELKYVFHNARWSMGSDMAFSEGTIVLPSNIAGPQELLDAYNSDNPGQLKKFYETEIEILAGDIEAYGWETFFISKSETAEIDSDIKSGKGYIENEYYRVDIDLDGRLNLTDKLNDLNYSNINYFIDGSDAGDEYNYSPALNDDIINSNDSLRGVVIETHQPVKACMKLTYRLKLPASLRRDRLQRSSNMSDLPVETVITLYSKTKRIEFETKIENTIKDHRLRVVFDTPINAEYSYALSPFDCVTRKIFRPEEASVAEGNIQLGPGEEVEVASYPHSGFVDVSDGTDGLCLIAEGLPEYEVIPGGNNGGVSVQLTLLRSVGWLSRSDLLTRKGHAGPMLAAPQAQCQGTHIFKYALVPHKGTYEESNIVYEALKHSTPMRSVQTYNHDGQLPVAGNFLGIDGKGIVISAVKLSEKKNRLVMRTFNITNRNVDATISSRHLIKNANLLNLQEDIVEELNVKNGEVKIQFLKKQIKTIEIGF